MKHKNSPQLLYLLVYRKYHKNETINSKKRLIYLQYFSLIYPVSGPLDPWSVLSAMVVWAGGVALKGFERLGHHQRAPSWFRNEIGLGKGRPISPSTENPPFIMFVKPMLVNMMNVLHIEGNVVWLPRVICAKLSRLLVDNWPGYRFKQQRCSWIFSDLPKYLEGSSKIELFFVVRKVVGMFV